MRPRYEPHLLFRSMDKGEAPFIGAIDRAVILLLNYVLYLFEYLETLLSGELLALDYVIANALLECMQVVDFAFKVLRLCLLEPCSPDEWPRVFEISQLLLFFVEVVFAFLVVQHDLIL